jgi:acetoin utilization deacetylase AcuC-like enzyme
MRVTGRGYAAMLQRISGAVPRRAPGRLGFVLEGGYDLVGLEESLKATLEALDAPPGETPTEPPTHEHDLDGALRAAKAHWRLD